MPLSPDPRLAPTEVRRRFNHFVRDTDDIWHRHTSEQIRQQLKTWVGSALDTNDLVLNAGSGGDGLDLALNESISLDVSERRLIGVARGIAGSIEALPLATSSIATIICVGSVINYCDPIAAISEFGRVARPGASLVLEFESSRSAELLLKRGFDSAATIVETFYGTRDETVWAYRPEYLESVLRAGGFEVEQQLPIHILSPWLLLLTRNIAVASAVARFDRLLRRIGSVSHYASNHMWLCRKTR